MPISMKARESKVKKLNITLPDDEQFDVWYRVGAYTPKFSREISDDVPNHEKAVKMICRLLAKWDVWEELDDNGQGIGERIPVTAEAIEPFDFIMLNAILNQVTKDQNPDPTPAAATGSFS